MPKHTINGVERDIAPYADLSGADLSGADLSGANLSYANLRGANLRDTDLYGANLSYADLSYANLSDANLRGADLSDADLSGANLSGANLSGANLRGANLRGANLRGAKYGDHTLHSLFAQLDRFIDPYRFYAFRLEDGSARIAAGCRWMTLAEYTAHVEAEYPGTPKATETLHILQFITNRAQTLGVALEPPEPPPATTLPADPSEAAPDTSGSLGDAEPGQ